MKIIKFFLTSAIGILFFHGCIVSESVDDTQKLAALRKVTMRIDSLNVLFDFPEGFNNAGQKSFSELAADDPDTYKNLANYTIRFTQYFTADNTNEGAKDAKFDGMDTDMIFSDFSNTPVTNSLDGFEINKGDTKSVQGEALINLKSHKLVGRYIIERSVEGDDLETALESKLYYTIGGETGYISPPGVQKDIPTRLTTDQKAFLKGLLDSGLLDE